MSLDRFTRPSLKDKHRGSEAKTVEKKEHKVEKKVIKKKK